MNVAQDRKNATQKDTDDFHPTRWTQPPRRADWVDKNRVLNQNLDTACLTGKLCISSAKEAGCGFSIQ